jgi:integrase
VPFFDTYRLGYPSVGMRTSRRHFGSVRRLPSGRWQARYWHDGARHAAADTFTTKTDAQAWLSRAETDVFRGAWVDPRAGQITFADYAERWLSQRYDLRPRTVELYRGLLSKHLRPGFGPSPLSEVTTANVRSWHAAIAKEHPVTSAKAYRLLRTILATAVADGLLATSPCTIKGAGIEKSAERKIPALDTVYVIADEVDGRYRGLILTAALAGLRLGELAALTRRQVDLVHKTITVEVQAQDVVRVGRVLGPPKSKAGSRTLAIPKVLVAVLDEHLATYVEPAADALVFTADKGGPLVRTRWAIVFGKAAKAAGAEELHFHDLRHVAGTLAAATGASTKELMARLGHSTARAALIYQHPTAERDHQIAAGIDTIVEAARRVPIADTVVMDAG